MQWTLLNSYFLIQSCVFICCKFNGSLGWVRGILILSVPKINLFISAYNGRPINMLAKAEWSPLDIQRMRFTHQSLMLPREMFGKSHWGTHASHKALFGSAFLNSEMNSCPWWGGSWFVQKLGRISLPSKAFLCRCVYKRSFFSYF